MLVFVPKSANESKIVKEKWAASIAVADFAFICYRSLALFFVEEKKRPLFLVADSATRFSNNLL